ncbi:ATP-binding protein [Alloscardovia criceti]|uniref:ATP-binding protein n=1 Tax=Alloscardovia criceti TaxID=356828 RepID=UPI0014613273|nr:ATP-binding protein [Alloscardovia criceti]
MTDNRNAPPVQDAPAARPLLPARYPLIRPYQGRIFAGVCKGLSLHLGVPVWLVRLIFIALTLSFGLGIIGYLFLWITVPSQNLLYAPYNSLPPEQTALSRGNNGQYAEHIGETIGNAFMPVAPPPLFGSMENPNAKRQLRWNLLGISVVGIVIIALGFLWAIDRHILDPIIAIEIVIAALCALGVWIYFESFSAGHQIVTAAALTLFIISVFVLIFVSFNYRISLQIFGIFLIGIISTALIAAPWLALSHQKLVEETSRKEREEERADMAAHLHDSVLQTLNLIRQNSGNADMVAQLARSQERELRRWLYEDREAALDSIASSMKLVSARVEDTFGVPIDVITVGDAQPNERTLALIEATQQALTNACVHGKTPISLYVESGARDIQVFVRDHGDGFDIDNIPADRMGIRHSMKGRVERAGGTVTIVSRPQWGTEVRMSLPLEDKR